jgi:hypothetical protein
MIVESSPMEKCPLDVDLALRNWLEYRNRTQEKSYRLGYPQTAAASGRYDIEEARAYWRYGIVTDAIQSFCRTKYQRLILIELIEHIAGGASELGCPHLRPKGADAESAIREQVASVRRRIGSLLTESKDYPQTLAIEL